MGEMVPQEGPHEMNAGAYRLGATRQYVRELYPVLLDAHGNIIDGYNRLDEFPGWRTETLSHITTPAQLWAARIIANSCRRTVSRGERAEEFKELARCLAEEGTPKDQVAAVISEITTFTERYVQMLLPPEYKRAYKSELSSLSAQVTVPRAGQPRAGAAESGKQEPREGGGLLPRPPGATARPEDDDAAHAPSEGAPVARGETRPGTPGPSQLSAPEEAGVGAPGQPGLGEAREEALRYIREYHDRYPRPDPEYLSWEVAIKTGVSEKTALELIGQVRNERGVAEPRREAQASVTCPLCSRDGAERSVILRLVQDPHIGQQKLWEFVMEAMQ